MTKTEKTLKFKEKQRFCRKKQLYQKKQPKVCIKKHTVFVKMGKDNNVLLRIMNPGIKRASDFLHNNDF